jgi:hypothetical protein
VDSVQFLDSVQSVTGMGPPRRANGPARDTTASCDIAPHPRVSKYTTSLARAFAKAELFALRSSTVDHLSERRTLDLACAVGIVRG